MKKQELDQRREEALRRYRIIAPLVEENLAESEKRNIRWLIREQEGMSSRTLRRYVAAFKKGGFDALLPRERKDKGVCKAISPEALLIAAELRRELPARSAERIQQILAGEGYSVARSTLERHLRQQGLSGRKIKAEQKQVFSRCFNRQGRNTLWQSDLKYGPYIPDPKKPNHKLRTYLVAIIDDATRLAVHAEFYDSQKLPVLEDTFRKAVIKCGLPDNLYVDNGKIFMSQWLRLTCAKLIRFTGYQSRQKFPGLLRRVVVWDEDDGTNGCHLRYFWVIVLFGKRKYFRIMLVKYSRDILDAGDRCR